MNEVKNHPKNNNAQPIISIVNQYLKNINLVNFLFPSEVNIPQDNKPKIDIGIVASASAIANKEDLFEVQINGNISASYQNGQNKLFELNFSYGSIFKVANVSDSEKEIILLVYCPSVIFPFARRIVSDVTRDAGFPPLMMDVIDFGKLYQDNKNNQQK